MEFNEKVKNPKNWLYAIGLGLIGGALIYLAVLGLFGSV